VSRFCKRCGEEYNGKECKPCHSVRVKEWKDKNRDKARKQTDRWYARTKSGGVHLRSHIKSRYSISQEDYAKLMSSTDGACEICGAVDKKLALDHNHDDGDIRGVLCRACNCGLGLFGDSIANLQKAMEYLKQRGSYGKTT
jgi:hypothetical protein